MLQMSIRYPFELNILDLYTYRCAWYEHSRGRCPFNIVNHGYRMHHTFNFQTAFYRCPTYRSHLYFKIFLISRFILYKKALFVIFRRFQPINAFLVSVVVINLRLYWLLLPFYYLACGIFLYKKVEIFG